MESEFTPWRCHPTTSNGALVVRQALRFCGKQGAFRSNPLMDNGLAAMRSTRSRSFPAEKALLEVLKQLMLKDLQLCGGKGTEEREIAGKKRLGLRGSMIVAQAPSRQRRDATRRGFPPPRCHGRPNPVSK